MNVYIAGEDSTPPTSTRTIVLIPATHLEHVITLRTTASRRGGSWAHTAAETPEMRNSTSAATVIKLIIAAPKN